MSATFKPWARPPKLREGERVRLTPGGPVRAIVRVSPTAAYYGYTVERTFTVTDRKTGEEKTITRTEHRAEAISAVCVRRAGRLVMADSLKPASQTRGWCRNEHDRVIVCTSETAQKNGKGGGR